MSPPPSAGPTGALLCPGGQEMSHRRSLRDIVWISPLENYPCPGATGSSASPVHPHPHPHPQLHPQSPSLPHAHPRPCLTPILISIFIPPVLKTIPSVSEASSNSKSVALHMVAELASVVLMHEEGILSATSADTNQPHWIHTCLFTGEKQRCISQPPVPSTVFSCRHISLEV